MSHQPWVLTLLGITAAASGLAGGYITTTLATSQPATPKANGDRALLSREQDFPPSERWPGNPYEPVRNVLFEDAAPNSRWLSERDSNAVAKSPPPWSPPVVEAQLEQSAVEPLVEQPVEITAESELAVQSDAPMPENATWDTTTGPVSSDLPPAIDITNSGGGLNGTLEATPVPFKPAIPIEDRSGGPVTGADLEDSGLDKAVWHDSWSAPRPEPVQLGTGGS